MNVNDKPVKLQLFNHLHAAAVLSSLIFTAALCRYDTGSFICREYIAGAFIALANYLAVIFLDWKALNTGQFLLWGLLFKSIRILIILIVIIVVQKLNWIYFNHFILVIITSFLCVMCSEVALLHINSLKEETKKI